MGFRGNYGTPSQLVMLLDNGAAVPPGTPAGTVILTKAVSGTTAAYVDVLLIDHGTAVPSGTPDGTIIVEKQA